MKKIYTVLLITIIFQINSFGQTFTVGGINYKVTSTNPATVEVGTNPSFTGDANIPNTVLNNDTTYEVKSIGTFAFFNCAGLKSVSIPNSVTTLGNFAFENCQGLTSVFIPNSVTKINMRAFMNDSNLTIVNMPNSVTELGTAVFYQCISLKTLNIPKTLTSIPNSFFQGCIGLTSITIPNTVKNIEAQAFALCSGLTSIIIPDSVTTIGFNAFIGCEGLTTINIPKTVTSIGNWAFRNCKSLTSVTVNWSSPLTIDNTVFQGLTLSAVKLNVPTGTKTAYSNSIVWQDFNIISTAVNNLDVSNEQLSICPNPVSNHFYIRTTKQVVNNFDYKIIDVTGRLVKLGKTLFNEQINIENLQNGNYFIEIETEDGEKLTKKLIKN